MHMYLLLYHSRERKYEWQCLHMYSFFIQNNFSNILAKYIGKISYTGYPVTKMIKLDKKWHVKE